MFLRSLKPVIVKEFRQIRRDPTSLGMLLVLPSALIILVGYALNFDVKHIPLIIFDQSKTAESREFLEQFKQSEYFSHRYDAGRYEEIEEHFLRNEASIALVVPTTFGPDMLAGRATHVQILVDGADANTAGQAVNYAARMTMQYSDHLVTDALRSGRHRS
jgi:ABC-2 type transport system permease protein